MLSGCAAAQSPKILFVISSVFILNQFLTPCEVVLYFHLFKVAPYSTNYFQYLFYFFSNLVFPRQSHFSFVSFIFAYSNFTLYTHCYSLYTFSLIGVAKGSQGGHAPPNCWKAVMLCFERRLSKQNSVIRLKSNILATPKFFPSLHF